MARRPTPTQPERPAHSVEEKRQAIARIERRIAELEEFDPTSVSVRNNDPQVIKLQTAIRDTLATAFGEGTREYRGYSLASRLDNGPIQVASSWVDARRGGYRENANNRVGYLTEGKAASLALLRQAVETLREEIEFVAPAMAAGEINLAAPEHEASPRVFVVHGHDEGARESVARFLEKIGFEPIVLHEQANQGRTVIEKVEANGDVGFAIVILTPDDQGAKCGESVEPRARQNVILEWGWFVGRLGRQRVCALKKGEVSIPSDFGGFVWEPMDENGGWKQALAKELGAAGYEVDWNLVMR